jgi:endonuclease/exonuclease/phosphatase family metal-dependent hydrolase
MRTVRIATLNLWNRSGPWDARLELIRDELATLRPDVLGMQEVLRFSADGASPDVAATVAATSDGADQASEVGAGYFSHMAYGRAWDMGGGLAFGNAVLSRWPILEHRVFLLPGRDTGETRSLLYALVDYTGARLPVFVTHLNWKLHHGSVRLEQVMYVAERVKELCPIDSPDLPPVLMGDFNAEPESDEIRYLRGLMSEGGRSVYFADAWAYGAEGGPGYTFDRKNRFAALAHEPPRRIDYVFVRGPDRAFRGEPMRTTLGFDRPRDAADGPIWASDHFGVVTDLAASPRSP